MAITSPSPNQNYYNNVKKCKGCKEIRSPGLWEWACEMVQMCWKTILQAQLRLTICNPMDCRPPGSSVHWNFQARILEWVAISSSKGIFPTQGLNLCLLHLLHRRLILYCWTIREAQKTVLWFLKEFNIESCDPAISLLGIFPKELKAEPGRDTCTQVFIVILFTAFKRWKQPNVHQQINS